MGGSTNGQNMAKNVFFLPLWTIVSIIATIKEKIEGEISVKTVISLKKSSEPPLTILMTYILHFLMF